MERSMKYKVFFLLLFAFIPESFSQDEDCDFKCRYEKLAGKELDRSAEKKSYKPSPTQSSFAKKEPLIYKKEEVQRWLDEITTEKIYYDGEPLWEQEIRFKLGNVRGNVDSFAISDIKVSLDYDEIFSIDEISARDNGRQGSLNIRFDSLNDFIEALPGNADFKWNGDFKLIGVRLAPDLYAELEEESIYDPIMGTVFKTGVLDSFSYSAEYTEGFKNITYEDIYSFNNKFKIQQEISLLSPPKELLETYASAVTDLFENELFSDCETNFEQYKEDSDVGADFPYSVFISDYFACIALSLGEAAIYDPEIINDIFYDIDLSTYDLYSEGSIAINMAWSKEVWDAASLASGGTIDAGLFAAKTFLTNKMSKYELVALLDGVGIPYEYKGLFDELAYEYYSNFFDEVKTFVNYPRGLGFKVEITDKIDPQVFMQVEDNPMLLFNILNKIEIDIYANPQIRNL